MDKSDKAEILAAINALGGVVAQLAARIEGLEATIEAQSVKIDRMDGDVRELRGQMSVALTWLQSMDQRFVALMHPYQPHKPAAE